MNPFDAPPSTPAVSYEPPRGPKRRRGRMVGAALLGAGLVGAGAIGVSALASADDPELRAAPTTRGPDLDEDEMREFQECIGLPDVWLDDWLSGELSGDSNGELNDELPPLDEFLGEEFDLDEMLERLLDELETDGDLDLFNDSDMRGEQLDGAMPSVDDLVVVIGPDGPTLIELGDGDGSVTVVRDGDSGELTITAEGSASELDLEATIDELFGEFMVPGLPDGVQSCLDGLDGA